MGGVSSAWAVNWTVTGQNATTAYFFVASPASVQRFDLTTRTWLSPITLPAARGLLTTGTVDADGLVVAYDKAVYRYNLNGGAEQFIVSSGDSVQTLLTDGNLLFINHSSGLYARVISVNKTTNQVIASFEKYIDSIFGAAIAPSVNRIFGSISGISPDDVSYVEYRDDGTFVGGGDSPYHGDYPSSSRVWVFPDDGRFVDDSGTIYSTSSLSYAGSFATAIDDIVFYGGSVPIVLQGTRLASFSNSILPAGSAELSVVPKKILVDGTDVLAFVPTGSGTAIDVVTVPLADLQAPEPGATVDPVGLPYTPDDVFSDGADILYIFSKAHQSVFRWQVSTQQYLTSIPLIGVPDYMTYSQADNRLYLGYASGLIRKIDLADPEFAEVPFVSLATKPWGLAAAGAYLFAADASGAWNTHYTFDSAGAKASSVDWNYYSKSYVWNEVRQKMYFFRDDTSPNDLLWEEINAAGTAYPALPPGAIGNKMDSPLHSSAGFTHPIRISLDGTVVLLGSGVLHDAVTLARLTPTLANAITDAAWSDSALFTIRTITGLTQFQRWSLSAYGEELSVQVPGTAHRMFHLTSQKLVSVSIAPDGIPSFYLLSNDFGVLPPAGILPPLAVAGIIQNTAQISLTWQDVSGETSYVIEKRTLPSGNWTVLGSTSTSVTSYSDPTVSVGNDYEYRVSAWNGAIQSAPSEVAQIKFTVPDAPVLSGSAVSSSRSQLGWSAVERATFYDLYRRVGATGNFALIQSLPAETLSYTDVSLASNTTYQYVLRSRNALGSSADSASVTITTLPAPPAAPGLSVPSATGPYSVALSWTDVANEDSYRIERRLGTSGSWSTLTTVSANVTTYTDQTVKAATQYSYRLFAVNSAGTSGASTIRTITTPVLPLPTAPGDPSGQAASASSIVLHWTDSAYESSYRIERTVGENPWIVIAASVPANPASYVDATVSNGVFYNYRIIAVNSKGETPSTVFTALAALTGAILSDDFDPGLDYSVWSSFSGATITSGPQGFLNGKAFWFGGAAGTSRSASTVAVDLQNGGSLDFSFRAGNEAVDGNTFWNNSEANEYVVLEYSTEAGNWTPLTILNTQYPEHSAWKRYSINLPTGARSAATSFRWRQVAFSGEALDTWALDDLEVRGILPPPPAQPGFILGSANSSRAVAISWAASSSATSYVIERRTSSTDWVAVGTSTFQTYFTDQSATPATLYSYRVKASNSGGDSLPSQTAFVLTWSVLEEWRFQNYGTLADQGTAASSADNGTGIPNLVRFAFNLAKDDASYQVPENGGTKGLPSIQFDDEEGRLHVAFIRRRAERNPGIQYQVEFSSNLGNWSAGGTEWYVAPISEDFEYVIWQDEMSEPSVRFGRVSISE